MKKTEWLIRKLIPAVLCIAVICLVGKFYREYQYKIAAETQSLVPIRDELSELDQQKQELQRELDRVKLRYAESNRPAYAIIPIFTTPDDVVFPGICDLLDSYGWTGVIAISSDWIPGAEGSLSEELYRNLLKRGWQACVYWNEKEPLPDYLSNLEDYLDEMDIEFPSTLIMKGTYDTDDYENLLDEYGLDQVVCYPPGKIDNLNTRWTDEARKLFYYCDWKERRLDTYISITRKQGGAFYTVCYTNDADRDDLELCMREADHFFEYIYKIEYNDRKCIVGSMEKYQLVKEREADGAFLTEKDMLYYETRISELERQIAEIDQKRETLLKGEHLEGD